MKVNSEELGPTKKRLQVEVPPPQVEEVVESLYRDLQKRVKVRGFRPGRIPRDVLERYYGDYVKEKAVSYLINDTYPKAISQESIEPIAPPLIDAGEFVPERPFNYSAVVEVRPRVEVRNYKGLKLKGRREEVTPEEVEEALTRIRELHSQVKPVEGRDRVQKGDVALLDFQGLLGTRPIRDGKAENYLLEVGSGTMVPGFEEGLIGKRTGVENEITVVFPSDHPRKDLAGKEISFRVTVKEIRQKVFPPLNNEFARDVGEYKDLETLKEKVRKDLQEVKERRFKEELRREAIDQLLRTNPFEAPSYLVERRTQDLLQDLKMRMAAQQRDLPLQEERTLQGEYRKVAEREVKASLLIEEIAQQEGIEVTDGEIKERLQEMAQAYGRPLEDLRQDSSLVVVLRRSLQREKVLDFLITEAKIKDKA